MEQRITLNQPTLSFSEWMDRMEILTAGIFPAESNPYELDGWAKLYLAGLTPGEVLEALFDCLTN